LFDNTRPYESGYGRAMALSLTLVGASVQDESDVPK